jgi:hypothetical protein
MLQRSKRQWHLVSLIGTALILNACTSAELAIDMYQMCAYRDKCPVELVGNWLNGG